MEIRSASVHRLRLPFDREYTISGGGESSLTTILVVIETSNGIRGLGTADPVPGHPTPQSPAEIYADLSDHLLPTVIDNSPTTPNHLRQQLADYAGEVNAICALELAYLDAFCRARGESLAEFLGGPLRAVEPVNGWVGVGSPSEMVAEAERLYDRGFRSFKAKLSGEGHADVERVQALSEAVGDRMEIRVDANEGYDSPDQAIKVATQLESHPIVHFEQPITRDDIDGLARVSAGTSLVVMADEPINGPADAFRFLKADAADRVKFKILKSGGILPTRDGLAVAAAAGMSSVVGHGFCSAPAASAEIQLTATQRNVLRPIETVGMVKIADQPFTDVPAVTNGTVEVPKGPGLGVGLAKERLDDFTVESVTVER